MKHRLKIITLLTLSTLSATVIAQVPNQTKTVQTTVVTSATGTKVEVPAQATAANDYSHIGEGNTYEKAVTPLLREISRKKSILELKKLDKEIAKLDEVEKKETQLSPVPVPVQSPLGSPAMTTTSAKRMNTSMALPEEEEMSSPVKVLMTYGSDDDLYAKIAVGEQGGYTVRKGDILPDGRYVMRVNSNFIEVQKAVNTKKANARSKTEKIFVSAGASSATPVTNTGRTGGVALPSSTPTIMPIPTGNVFSGSNQTVPSMNQQMR